MIYLRKLFTQDLRDGKQIAFPKEPSYSFFHFDFQGGEGDRTIKFVFNSKYSTFQNFDGREIQTRLYSAGSEARIDGQVKAFLRDELKAQVDDIVLIKNVGTRFTDYSFCFIKNGSANYSFFLDLMDSANHIVLGAEETSPLNVDPNLPLQQIYYGAPGTGKSYEINRLTKGCEDVFRTTFHPDSDYSTFVGSYKPVEDAVQRTYIWMNPTTGKAELLPVVNATGNVDLEKEKKITYKFVQQAFVKAYIRAWEKFNKVIDSDSSSTSSTASTLVSSSSPSGTFTLGDTIFRVNRVNDDRVEVKKDINFKKQSVLAVWKRSRLWIDGEFTLPTGVQSGASLQYAVCKWIADNLDNPTNTIESFEEGWNLLLEELQEKGLVSMSSLNQIYTATASDTTDVIHISWKLNSRKKRLEKCFNGEAKSAGAEIGLVNILKNLNSESFDDAWENLRHLPADNSLSNDVEIVDITDGIENKVFIDPVYLIIEEINRGNCAQIFGDLFQLLDRNEAGFSTYAINADSDLAQELRECFSYVQLDDQIKNYINDLFKEHYDDIVEKVLIGELLLLPNNLYIWATMNTSDQSLFPIDSAFKRRWDWEYVPIKYSNKDWLIDIAGVKYSWTNFQQVINDKIYDATESEDKKLGDFFVKAENNVITGKLLLNKIIFYLWNDVCKDGDGDIFKIVTDPDSSKKLEDAQIEDIKFSEFFDNTDTKLQQWMRYLNVKPE